jgi:hypothetical protein
MASRENLCEFASAGSQKWLQVAVERRPDVLLQALSRAGAVGQGASIEWRSPLRGRGFKEYRDEAALALAGVTRLKQPLSEFWPARGPVWDAIATAPAGPIFVEAKAHIPEAASPPSRAGSESAVRISQSLVRARRWYAPRASAPWNGLFYQYGNRLAHHFFLRQLNGVPSTLVFLYFLNAADVGGPASETEWRGAIRLIHAALGLPADLKDFGVHDAFIDADALQAM